MTSYGGNLHASSAVEISAVEPSAPTVGLIWHNTTNGEIKIYDGTAFQSTADIIARGMAIALG